MTVTVSSMATANATRLAELFKCINGLLYTGGGADISSDNGMDKGQYFRTATTLWDLAVRFSISFATVLQLRATDSVCFDAQAAANKQGDYFPIWGTCLGFQTVSVLAAGNRSLLSPFTGVDGVSIPLTLTAAANASRLLTGAPARVMNTLTTEDSTVNLHHWGVTPSAYADNPKLDAFFELLSTNVDSNGSVFVSTIEGKELPVYATQYYPERFDWALELRPFTHAADVVEAMGELLGTHRNPQQT